MKKYLSVLPVAALAFVACSDRAEVPTGLVPDKLLRDNVQAVQNSVLVGGTATIPAGGSATISYRIAANNGDDQRGCNASDGSTASVTPSLPLGVTAIPSSLVFATCDIEQNIVFSSSTPGSYSISVDVSDSGLGTYNTNPADFSLVVNAAVVTDIDDTPPVIVYTLDPASPDGQNGWYKGDVELTWNVTDGQSAVSIIDGCINQSITTDQAETIYFCSATSDGGSAGPVEIKIKRDATAPVVSLVGGPDDGRSYYFGSVPAAPTCQGTDVTSGVNGDCIVSVYSTTVGSHTVTATATDMAGNSSTATKSYTVLAWTLSGFYNPVDMNGVLNVVKGGSSVPLKFNVFAGTTEITDISAVASFRQSEVACSASAHLDEVEVVTTGGTSLRYDATGKQFIQNWQTPKMAGKCYRVTMTTRDGSKLEAYFKMK